MNKIRKKIAEAIKGTRFENKTFIVGGYVRDKVMGIQSEDMDIVVELKNGGKDLANFLFDKGISSRPVIFPNFGTAFVMIKNHKIEFVMTRKESYREKDRKPDVEQGTIEEDIFRRDFTINSLIMNIVTEEIQDVTGKGFPDIKNKIIRSTSVPEIIFSEDPLRMLRAVRFAVQLGFYIEENTREGILNNANKLKYISWERRRDELIKIMVSNDPVAGIRLLIKFDLMKNLIPEIYDIKDLEQNRYHDLDVLEHSLEVVSKTSPDPVLRIAALLHDIGKAGTITKDEKGIHFYGHESTGADITKKILKKLKFPKDTITKIYVLIKHHMRLKNAGENAEKFSDKAIRKLIFDLGDNLDKILDLIHADNLCHAPDYCMPKQIPELKKRISEIKNRLTDRKSPVKGKDVIEYFKIKSGKKVGILLKQAEDIWLEHPEWDKTKILKAINFKEETNGRQRK